jgi:uncharacterized protein (DUF488 family)
MSRIFTIGYEGASPADFIDTLCLSGVKHLMDVREIAQSRRRGFSKNALSSALTEAGIGYSHWRQLGDPKPGRDAARAGRMDDFRAIFAAHLELPETAVALREAANVVRSEITVLMCFERDPKSCHRSLVAKRLSDLCSLSVRHLGVIENAGGRQFAVPKAA